MKILSLLRCTVRRTPADSLVCKEEKGRRLRRRLLHQERDAVPGHPRRHLSGGIGRALPIFCGRLVIALLFLLLSLIGDLRAETIHQVHFRGTDCELHVYKIKGNSPGPTLMVLGGIQGDEPGGYLAADLYADLSLQKGNLIVVPRANFFSIVEDSRGVHGDMNRKFADVSKRADREAAVVEIIKQLMRQSDVFLNLHDGSGFYAPTWESPQRNPKRFGQSVIADAAHFARPDGTVIELEKKAQEVLEKVNAQISLEDHHFRFNNHETLKKDTLHKEQRLSATFHALTRVGIPAFGIETSKDIKDYRQRVKYQTMVINGFLDVCGIVPEHPRMYLENPYLKYLIVSVNGRTPIVVDAQDVLRVQERDKLRIVHIESNYSRGLTARVRGSGQAFNDLNNEVSVARNSVIEVRKDRFLIASVPVEIVTGRSGSSQGTHFEPKVHHFCVRVDDKTYALEPGEELRVIVGDTIVILDPRTNLGQEDEKAMRIDLRGFQADSSPYPLEDRGHQINTATQLQEKYARIRGNVKSFPLQARLGNKVFSECFITVEEPRLEYLVLREAQGATFVAYPEDKLQVPGNIIVKLMDIKTNVPQPCAFFLTMAGKTVRWGQAGSAGIDATKLTAQEMPLDVVRNGRSLGKIWLKQGKDFRISSGGHGFRQPVLPVRY
jgi:hypothetical protein